MRERDKKQKQRKKQTLLKTKSLFFFPGINQKGTSELTLNGEFIRCGLMAYYQRYRYGMKHKRGVIFGSHA